jgi:hypothetical protein
MLEHHRRRVVELLESAKLVTLSTCGRAGIQAQVLTCAGRDLRLYMLVPTPSENLFNLEQEPMVVVTTSEWQARGSAKKCPPEEELPDLPLCELAQTGEFTIVEMTPTRMNIGRPDGMGFSETIDINEPVLPLCS